MADVKWIKIVTDIFDDEKILLIESLPESDSIIVIWFKLLCLAGKQNNSGVFKINDSMPYTDKMFSTIFRRKETTVQLALSTFQQFGMIEIIDNTVTIPNWGKHQNLDKIEQKNEYMKGYMQEYREKQKLLVSCKSNSKVNSKTNGKSNCKANVSEADKNKNKKENKNKIREERDYAGDKSPRSIFEKPTIQDIKAYCLERHNNVDPEVFFDFYESKNWMIGKSKMKDWRAAVRTWEKRQIQEKKEEIKNPFMRKLIEINEQERSSADFNDSIFGLSING